MSARQLCAKLDVGLKLANISRRPCPSTPFCVDLLPYASICVNILLSRRILFRVDIEAPIKLASLCLPSPAWITFFLSSVLSSIGRIWLLRAGFHRSDEAATFSAASSKTAIEAPSKQYKYNVDSYLEIAGLKKPLWLLTTFP